MGPTPWILITIIALLLIVLGVFFYYKKNKGQMPPTDYKTFFVIGIVWIAIGLPLDNAPLWALGIVFTIVGLINKDKWNETKPCNPEQRKWLTISLALGVLFLAVGIVVYYLKARS